MFRKLFVFIVLPLTGLGFALAQVEVNKADQAAFDGIKGIGPSTSIAIIAERGKGGGFKDWADFQARVKGVGEKSAIRLSEAGLTVNGLSKPAPAAKVAVSTSAKPQTVAGMPASK
jgi:competence protein ComEA